MIFNFATEPNKDNQNQSTDNTQEVTQEDQSNEVNQDNTNTSTNNNQDQSTENETNDSQPKGDVGMDTDQQQKNIDAAKAAQKEEGYVTYPTEDEDMSEAYERQKEIYEKQARGELPQPGEGPITEE